jgi:hypothetical protein
MTEGQTLFLILGLLYLSECLVWIGRRSVLFSSRWCYRWRASFAGEYFGNADGGIALLNPLPPLGSSFLGHWVPVSISPDGVCALTLQGLQDTGRPLQAGMVLAYEEISDTRADGKQLLLNGSRFAKCCTMEQATSLAKLIKRVLSAPMEQREKLIRESLVMQFAKEEALNHLAQVSDLAARMRWNCSAFFIFLYVITPIIVSTYGLNRFVIPVALVMLLSALFLSVTYFRAHKTLCPSQSHDRLSNVVKMILCPPMTIRAADLLTLNALSQFHPVLLANLLLGSDSVAFTRAVITDLKYPIRYDLTDRRALSIVSWYAECELDACTKFLETQNSTTLDDLLVPPSWDGVSSAYCPRCSCQFITHSGECPYCPGVNLLPFLVVQTSEAMHE